MQKCMGVIFLPIHTQDDTFRTRSALTNPAKKRIIFSCSAACNGRRTGGIPADRGRYLLTKFEQKLISTVQRYVIPIGFAAIAVLAFLLRWAFRDHVTGDWSIFLSKWIESLKQFPGISGIGQSVGEYYVPYMLFLNIIARTPFNDLYEIKLLSILFDYVLAFAAVILICGKKQFFTGKGLAVFFVIMMSPIVFLDSAYWGQCDSIYVSALVFCLHFLFRERYRLTWVFFGLALMMKLQTVFLLPVLLIYYFATRRMSILNALYAIGIYLAAAIPALIAGRGLGDTLTIYLRQTGLYRSLTLSCPNLYYFLTGDFDEFHTMGILLTLCVLGFGACLFIKRRYTTPYAYMTLAVWTSMVCIYFLPTMHERYVYISCILIVIWAAMTLRRTDILAAIGLNLVALVSFQPYLFSNNEVRLDHMAVYNLAVLGFLTYRLLTIREKKEASPAK